MSYRKDTGTAFQCFLQLILFSHLPVPVKKRPVASLHGAPLDQLGKRLDDDKTINDSTKETPM